MKNNLLKLSLLLTIVLFASCGKSGVNLSTAEGITEAKKTILEKFDGEKEVYTLSLSTEGELKSELGYVSADYLDNDVMFSDRYLFFVPKPELKTEKSSIQGKSFIRNKKGKIKIKDFNFDQINTKFNEGVEIIGEDYEGFVLADWHFDVGNDNSVTNRMTIEATKKGEGSSVEGRNIVTNYYEFEFKIDKDGKLAPKM